MLYHTNTSKTGDFPSETLQRLYHYDKNTTQHIMDSTQANKREKIIKQNIADLGRTCSTGCTLYRMPFSGWKNTGWLSGRQKVIGGGLGVASKECRGVTEPPRGLLAQNRTITLENLPAAPWGKRGGETRMGVSERVCVRHHSRHRDGGVGRQSGLTHIHTHGVLGDIHMQTHRHTNTPARTHTHTKSSTRTRTHNQCKTYSTHKLPTQITFLMY